jgi:hypothetical protein
MAVAYIQQALKDALGYLQSPNRKSSNLRIENKKYTNLLAIATKTGYVPTFNQAILKSFGMVTCYRRIHLPE